MKITGNTILITGGTSGIGLALARALSAKGNRVAITGRDPDKLKRILGENPEWIGYAIDLIRPESVLELATSIQSDQPELNLLINNAGLQFEHRDRKSTRLGKE